VQQGEPMEDPESIKPAQFTPLGYHEAKVKGVIGIDVGGVYRARKKRTG